MLFGTESLRMIKETCTSIDWFPVVYTRLVNWEFLRRAKRSCNENKIVCKKYQTWSCSIFDQLFVTSSIGIELSFFCGGIHAGIPKRLKSRFWNLRSQDSQTLQCTRCRKAVHYMRPGAEREREGRNHIIIFGSPPEIWTRRRRRKGRMRRRPERRQIYRSASVAAAAASFSSKTGFSDEWVRSFFYPFRCHGESFIVREWVAWNTSRAQT